MSVLIKGMEMPRNCWECPCSDKSNGVCEAIVGGATIWDDRPAWCPLVPVPDHGRLIDANALWDVAYKAWGTEYDPWVCNLFMEMINNAPTIIPAEEGEE